MSPRLPSPLLAVQSDGRLVDLAGGGHERAFEALVKRYRAPLLGYCRRMGLSETLAEDVLQQSLTKAWVSLEAGAQIREFRPWLYRIVHNSAISALRSNRRQETELNERTELTAVRSGGASPEGAIQARDVLGHVAALPESQRDAVVLAAIQGRSHEEVAHAMGISDGAVRGLLHRARSTLRSAAAALTPQGLIESFTRGAGPLPLAERGGEVAAGGGAVGLAGAIVKGAVVAVTAAAVVAGTAVVRSDSRHRAHRAAAGALGSPREVPGPAAGSLAATSLSASVSPTGEAIRRPSTPPHGVRLPSGGRQRQAQRRLDGASVNGTRGSDDGAGGSGGDGQGRSSAPAAQRLAGGWDGTGDGAAAEGSAGSAQSFSVATDHSGAGAGEHAAREASEPSHDESQPPEERAAPVGAATPPAPTQPVSTGTGKHHGDTGAAEPAPTD